MTNKLSGYNLIDKKWLSHGDGRMCPICGKLLSTTSFAMSTHLRYHIKRKEITVEQQRLEMDKMFPHQKMRIELSIAKNKH